MSTFKTIGKIVAKAKENGKISVIIERKYLYNSLHDKDIRNLVSIRNDLADIRFLIDDDGCIETINAKIIYENIDEESDFYTTRMKQLLTNCTTKESLTKKLENSGFFSKENYDTEEIKKKIESIMINKIIYSWNKSNLGIATEFALSYGWR